MTPRPAAPPTVVFDLDGTLIDSIPDVVGALNRLLVEERRREISLDEGRGMVGEGALPMVEQAFKATGAAPSADELTDLVARYLANYRRHPVVDTIVYAGVEGVLQRLGNEGIKLGICTNKPHGMSELVLDELGLSHHFAALIGGDALDIKKPHPGHLLAVLDELDGAVGQSVYVGDSPIDAETARNAGVPFVGVSYGYSRVPPEQLGADVLIDDFADLPAALRRVKTIGTS